MHIINLTQHNATAQQLAEGVFEPSAGDKAEIQALLTFATPPTKLEMGRRAEDLALIAKRAGADAAMIGGAPYFMGQLEHLLKLAGVSPLYSFSERKSVDQPQADGTVRKVAVFEHVGWVQA